MGLYLLTDRDKTALDRLLSRERARVTRLGQLSAADPEDSQTPETYVVLTPVGGIPALDYGSGGTGTGTMPGSGDAPGYAACDVYRILYEEGDSTYRLRPVSDLAVPVFNVGTSDVAGETWALAHREKFGEFVVGGSGTGSGTGFQFCLGPVHVVSKAGTGTSTADGDWYCQRVHRSGPGWVVSAGPTDFAPVVEVHGREPRTFDHDATPGAAASAVTTLYQDANGVMYVDFPYLTGQDTLSVPSRFVCVGSEMVPSQYQTALFRWNNRTAFPNVSLTIEEA